MFERRYSRRDFTRVIAGVGAAAVAGVAVPGREAAAAGVTTIRYGSIWPTTHFGFNVEQRFADRVAASTAGAVKIVVYPNSQLGTEREMTESVKIGALEMTTGGAAIQGYVPEVGLFYLPYMYRDFRHFQTAWTLGRSPVADTIARIVESKAGIKVLGYSLGGARDTALRNHPVEKLTDYRGVKIRVDDAPTSYATFKALGASPVPVPFNQVYTALQTGVIDAAENPPANVVSLKWYEQTKYLSLTDHLMVLNLEMVNLNFWNKLPREVRSGIQQAMVIQCQEFAREAFAARDASIRALKQAGMVVNEIRDKSEFVAAVESMNRDFAAKHGLEKEMKWILAAG
jgi:tripartite ATP-independent transporter DctP family solute receptor